MPTVPNRPISYGEQQDNARNKDRKHDLANIRKIKRTYPEIHQPMDDQGKAEIDTIDRAMQDVDPADYFHLDSDPACEDNQPDHLDDGIAKAGY